MQYKVIYDSQFTGKTDVVYINAVPYSQNNTDAEKQAEGWGTRLYELCGRQKSLALVIIYDFDWNADLSPWPCERVFKKGEDFAGHADEFLVRLKAEVIDSIEGSPELAGRVGSRCIAGYSLAGLFALYAAYRSEGFDYVISASGSLWYPGLCDYIKGNSALSSLQRIYLSLGDKEPLTKNPVMSRVGDCTEEIYEHFKQQGTDVKFEYNDGGHFADDAARLVKGIKWIYEDD